MACLVRQLFRLKIGRDVDPDLIDDVMFPLLLTRRYQPNQLLQDIKLTRGPLEYVDKYGRHKESSLILLEREEEEEYDDDHACTWWSPKYDNITHFTPRPWTTDIGGNVGKRTSTIRMRDTRPREWGTIDIVNKLRSLKNPHHDHNYRWIYTCEQRIGVTFIKTGATAYTLNCPLNGRFFNASEIFICNTLQVGGRLKWSCGDFEPSTPQSLRLIAES
jgi:hypothetical protein